jgi:beta-1,4-mannosyl-glycoprotein beta-1,4-N-acetylglucosaminyltransferase|tara:strand:- start:1922 stop:2737 length:816 start_codon:yes stop_codon:yes gene_type:complete
MKVYDCFSYWDEDLLLELRLSVLNNSVDYFVIVEGNKTWQNNPKKLRFDINKFRKFKDKIIYIPVEDMPGGDNPWVRENFQRNCIERGLSKAQKEDWIIISDLDEIPNPESIKNFMVEMRYATFKQNHYYYKLNLQSKDYPYWNGSRICIKKYLKSPQWLRNLKFKKRPKWRIDKFRLNNILDKGGWHFCNLKSAEQLLYKYSNMCETNDQYAFNQKISLENLQIEKIRKRILNREDIIGREGAYEVKKLDDSFPKEILINKEKFKEWIVN